MSKPSVSVLGSGQVSQVLALGFQRHGYPVVMGTRDPAKLAHFSAEHDIAALPFRDAIAGGEVVVLAVKGTAAEELVASVTSALAGKVVIDATNPIADLPPRGGVLTYFTGANESLMERLQALAPEAHFVKAFNSVGNPYMVNPSMEGGPPTMFIAGDDGGAKHTVAGILTDFGWEAEDMGPAPAAGPIEALCQLWCARGMNGKKWNHAFKLLKA